MKNCCGIWEVLCYLHLANDNVVVIVLQFFKMLILKQRVKGIYIVSSEYM